MDSDSASLLLHPTSCIDQKQRSISQPDLRSSLHHLLSTSFRLPQSSENLQEICKIKNLDTGEFVDFNDLQLPSFDNKLKGLTQMDNAEVTGYILDKRKLVEQLWTAVANNDTKTVKALLDPRRPEDQVPQPNSRGKNGWTALHIAAAEGHVEVANVLIRSGHFIDVNARTHMQRTPLHWAADNGHFSMTELLLESGAEVDAIDEDGNSPLHLATEKSFADVCSMLMLGGANLELHNNQGQTPMQLVKHIDTANLLFDSARKRGIPIPSDGFSRIPFHNVLLRNSRNDVVSKLLEKVKTKPNPNELKKFLERPDPIEYLKRRLVEVRVDTFIPQPKQTPCSPDSVPENFEVLSKLGKGAFGEVYKVKEKGSGQVFAMKILDKEEYFKSKLLRYAQAERNVLVMLHHPFITRLHYAFQTDIKLVLVMEYCPGGDLSKMIFKTKRLDEWSALYYVCELILALEELHEHNVIYRDLKPENILFDCEGHAKITDFGLSKELDDAVDPMTKTFCGTISYIAPEVIRRRGYTKAVDWYALGIVYYEMLEGKTPYSHQRRDLTIRNIMHGELSFRVIKAPDLRDLLSKVKFM
mmetsp:Transcript_27338/g.49173  ORF Transcript_27338/g.49173 Transcript_27338/m.49173 type:complete len:585 (+) Transcript_27338:1072-2826(+)